MPWARRTTITGGFLTSLDTLKSVRASVFSMTTLRSRDNSSGSPHWIRGGRVLPRKKR